MEHLTDYEVVVVRELPVLKDDILGVNQAKLRRVEADLTSQEEFVFELVHLTVGPDVWRSPEAYALNMQVFLLSLQFRQISQ